MLRSLQEDHKNIAKLLRVLENKLQRIRNEQAVKYQLICDIVNYLHDYADAVHHPKEDTIYAYYLTYHASEQNPAQDLQAQHVQLKALTEELQDILAVILLDAVVPLDLLSERLEAYVKAQWQHLSYEEEQVFPELARCLSEDDWRTIEYDWQHSRNHDDDPLFGHQVHQQYQALAERIRLSELVP